MRNVVQVLPDIQLLPGERFTFDFAKISRSDFTFLHMNFPNNKWHKFGSFPLREQLHEVHEYREPFTKLSHS